MKTTTQIKQEIESAIHDGMALDPKKFKDFREYENARQKIRNNIKFMNNVKLYLESNPTREFIVSEIARIEKIMAGLTDGFELKLAAMRKTRNIDEKRLMAEFKREQGFTDMKKKVTFLKYILS